MNKLTGNKHPRSLNNESTDDDPNKNLYAIGFDPQTIENEYTLPPAGTPTNPDLRNKK
jgi:hypothetical protein